MTRGGVQFYPCEHDGKVLYLPRTTNVVKTLGLGSEALMDWAARIQQAATLEAALEVHQWIGVSQSPEAFVEQVAARIGKTKAHILAKDKAADVGSQAHEMIRWRLRAELGDPVGPEPKLSDGATVAYMAWEDWWRGAGLKPIAVERTIYDPDWGYAGTFDLLAQAPDGEPELWDWKSSNYLLLDHHVQLAAYRRAIEPWCPLERAFLLRVPKTLERVDIEIQPLGRFYHFRKRRMENRSPEQLLRIFRAALDVFIVLNHPEQE